jgi:hypothetical protein
MDNFFTTYLHADGPFAELKDELQLYGQFVGSWDFDARTYDEHTGQWNEAPYEAHFGWVLGGRAIQDVWGRPDYGWGTTVRTYDPRIQAWRIQWAGPRSGFFSTFIGRQEGDRIVQHGTQQDGRSLIWSFNEITPDSFVWRGQVSDDGGTTYRLEQEMHAHRRT